MLADGRNGRRRRLQNRFTKLLKLTFSFMISLGLMEGDDIYQIAKNCCTSVKMIEKY
jgi:hypothetical protein